jgi:hypothetical protein
MRKPNKKPIAPAQRPRRRQAKAETNSTLVERLNLRDDFFRNQINPRQLLEAFDHVPDVRYFVKDAQSRLMALSRKRVAHLGLISEEEVIGHR